MEAAHTPASALLGGEFRHGPLEMVKKGFIAILFAHSQSETYEQSLSLVKDILKYEGKVIFITDSNLVFENDNLCAITTQALMLSYLQSLYSSCTTSYKYMGNQMRNNTRRIYTWCQNNINRINYENCVSKENCNWSRYWRD